MPRRPCVAALALCVAFLGACERPARRVRRKRPSQFEAELTRREEALDATEDKLVEVLKDVAPADEDATATPPAPDLAGVGAMRAQVRAMRQAVASIVLTPHDTEGLEALCRGEHAYARERFLISESTKPGREFPLYFLGAIEFQEGNYALAERHFARTLGRNAKCRSAALLGRLARLCEGRRTIDTAQLVLLFRQACAETLQELALDDHARLPSVADALVPPLAADPVLFKAQEFVGGLASREFWSLARAYAAAPSPEAKLDAALLMGDNIFADALIQSLAQEHPGNRAVRTFAFLHRHFARSPDDAARARPSRAAELEAGRQIDPDNGALLLLAIDAGEGGETPTPLSDSEVVRFRAAVRAASFATCAAYHHEKRLAGYLDRYGPLASYAPMTRVPSVYMHVARVARRAAAAAAKQFGEGEVAEALKLSSDVEMLATRVVGESGGARAQLVADAVLDSLYEAIQAHAAQAGRAPLLKSSLERRAEIYRRRAWRLVAWDRYVLTLFKMPVRRLVEAAMELENSPERIQQVAIEKLQASPAEFYQEAVARLAGAGADTVPAGAYEYVILLGELRDRNAIPTLIRLAGHRDRLIAHLATRAFSAIADVRD